MFTTACSESHSCISDWCCEAFSGCPLSWFKRFCMNLLVFMFCHLRRLSNKREPSHTSQKYAKNSCVIIITIKLTTIQIGQFITFSKDERMYCMPQNSIHFMCHCASLTSFFRGFFNPLYVLKVIIFTYI